MNRASPAEGRYCGSATRSSVHRRSEAWVASSCTVAAGMRRSRADTRRVTVPSQVAAAGSTLITIGMAGVRWRRPGSPVAAGARHVGGAAASGDSASVRRWVLVRGSSGHTVAASSLSLVSKAAASGPRTFPRSRPSRSARGSPRCGDRDRVACHPHRVGVGSMTSQSTSSVIFSRESVFHDGALAASWASMVASAAVSVSRSVRKIARGDHPKVHCTGQKHRTRAWGSAPAVWCRSASARNARRPADPQFGADLGGDGLPVIDTPDVVLAGRLLHAAQGEPAHRQQLARERRPLGLRLEGHRPSDEQLRITASLSNTIFTLSAPSLRSQAQATPRPPACG